MDNYDYKDLPLTPFIIEELIVQLFSGRMQERQTIVSEVLSYHERNGGKGAKAIDITGSFKTALNNLKAKGIAENPTYGFWRIGDKILPENIEPSEQTISESISELELEPQADLILGVGKSAVYVYYLPLYKLNAQNQNESKWPCKIGRTDRDPLLRVLSQASTALPEKPHIALIIKTDFASDLELAVHSILSLRNRRIDSAPGTEWFLTAPDEILQIINFIFPNLSSK